MWLIKVLPQSAAEAAGLKVGDVILSIDGKSLNVIAELPGALKDARVSGHTAHLSVARAGQSLEVLVPAPDPAPLGASARNLTPPSPAGLGSQP